jgi:hypothetical protein
MFDRKWIILAMAFGAALGCDRGEAGAPSATSAVTGSIGVAECDDYLTKYNACVSRVVPASARGPLLDGAAQMRTSWKETARNPSVRSGLASGCSRALEAAKRTMAAYDCSW